MLVLPRRTFLSAATAAAGGFALACVDRTVGVPLLSRAASSLQLDPGACGIEHVVVMMMENRSFDHFLGWLPDADGRFFDHVPPPAAPIPDATRAAGDTDGLRGFRTPALLISPLARRGHTSHALYDHTSVLRMIEWRWNLEPLTVRDRTANNLALELDFTRPRLDAAAYPVPPVTGAFCPANPGLITSGVAPRWEVLHDVARKSGWSV